MNIKTRNGYPSLIALGVLTLFLNFTVFGGLYNIVRNTKQAVEPLLTLSLVNVDTSQEKPKAKRIPKPKPVTKKTITKQPHTKKRIEKTVQTTNAKVLNKPVEIPRVPINLPIHVKQSVSPAIKAQDTLPEPIPMFKLTELPRFLHKQEPIYPEEMISMGKEVLLKLSVLVDKKGKVRQVEVIKSGGTVFDRSARSALMASTFIPAKLKGKAVPAQILLPIRFKLL